jgi:hypothetical protein
MQVYGDIDITTLDWNGANRLFRKLKGLEKGIVYCYTNLVNGKVYIGQTISPKIRHNCHTHFSRIGPIKKEGRTPFHSALRKYGIDAFSYKILELVITDSRDKLIRQLDELEARYIKECNSLVTQNGYNIIPGSTQTKSHGAAYNARKVCQYTTAGEFIAEYECVADAAKAADLANINLPLRDPWRTAGGYLWRYKGEVVTDDIIEKYQNAMIHQYTPDGVYVASYSGYKEASKVVGIKITKLHEAVKHPRCPKDGYRWVKGKRLERLLDEPTRVLGDPVYCYNAETGEFVAEYSNCADAGRKLGIVSQSIIAAVNKNNRTAKGLFWRSCKLDKIEIPQEYVKKSPATKIYRYDIDGTYIDEFETIASASTIASSISHALDKRLTSGGYQWRTYKVDKIEPIIPGKRCLCNVYQYDKQGSYVGEFDSYADAARAVGLKSYTPIPKAVEDPWRIAGGFYWRRTKEEKLTLNFSDKKNCRGS